MYNYMYVYIYSFKQIMYSQTYTFLFVYIFMYTYESKSFIYINTHIHIYIYIYIYIYLYTYIYTYSYANKYVYIYVQIYLHLFTNQQKSHAIETHSIFGCNVDKRGSASSPDSSLRHCAHGRIRPPYRKSCINPAHRSGYGLWARYLPQFGQGREDALQQRSQVVVA